MMSKNINIQAPKGINAKTEKPAILPLEINPKNKRTGLNMQVKVKIDGKTVDEFMSDSFTYLFAQVLQALMHGGTQKRHIPFVATGFSSSNVNKVINVSVYDGSLKVKLLDNRSFRNGQVGDKLWIYGVEGIPEANGFFKVAEKIDNQTVKIVNLDDSNIITSGSYVSGGRFGSTGLRTSPVDKQYGSGTAIFGFPSWRIGIGTSSKPVSIYDFGLWKYKSSLPQTPTNATGLVTDKPSSRFTLVSTFTNNTGADLEINEYGIISKGDVYREKYENIGISRDVRPSKTVPASKTITVEMTPIIRLTPDTQDTDTDGTNGGFLKPFMERLLYLAQENYSSSNNYIFSLATPPGNASIRYNNKQKPTDYGIILGKDNKFTSMTDQSVISRIEHGSEDGQLYHYGTDVRPLVIEEANNEAYYNIVRLFGNEGATPITIKETALMATVDAGYQGGPPTIIARHALAASEQITIQPGTIKPIIYRVSVIA